MRKKRKAGRKGPPTMTAYTVVGHFTKCFPVASCEWEFWRGRMNAPMIFLTRKEASVFACKEDGERVVRVRVTVDE